MEKICNVTFRKESWSNIPTNPTWRPWPPFYRRPVSAMFSIAILHLSRPRQQVASLSHITSWGSNRHNWRLFHTSWFIPTTKGNTISLGWPCLQRFTHCPVQHPSQLLTAQKSHTDAWLEALPIASVGNLLSTDELQIAIALRTGAKNFESTECHCGKFVDRLGLHGLSCIKKESGPLPQTFIYQLHPQRIIDPHWSPLCLGVRWCDKIWKEAWWFDPEPLVQRQEPCMGHDSCIYLCSKPLHSQCHYTKQCSNLCWLLRSTNVKIQWSPW